jgi:hypothetical protein
MPAAVWQIVAVPDDGDDDDSESVERELARKTEVLGETLFQFHFI